MSSDEGLYAYALVAGAPTLEGADELGIGGQPVRLVTVEDVSAVVSPVDLGDFGEEGLKAHMEDLRWLEQVAFAHDAVVRAAAEAAPAAPLRLATVFRTEDSVRARLHELLPTARQVFEHIDGRSEWSVKAYTVPVSPGLEETEDPAPTSGAAYLKRRANSQSRQERALERAEDACNALHDRLLEVAVDARLLQPQDRVLSGHTGEMLLNGTYLVDDDRAEDFAALVRSSDGGGEVRFTVDGPWAPYSFCSLEGGDADDR